MTCTSFKLWNTCFLSEECNCLGSQRSQGSICERCGDTLVIYTCLQSLFVQLFLLYGCTAEQSGGKSGEKTCFGRRRSTRRASIAMLFRRKLMLRFKKSIEAICVWPILPPGWAWWENHFLFLDHSHHLWESKHYCKSWSCFSNCWWRWWVSGRMEVSRNESGQQHMSCSRVYTVLETRGLSGQLLGASLKINSRNSSLPMPMPPW